MPRFHFDLFNDQYVLDEEGCELADLAMAKGNAIAAARSLMAEDIVQGRPIKLDHRISNMPCRR